MDSSKENAPQKGFTAFSIDNILKAEDKWERKEEKTNEEMMDTNESTPTKVIDLGEQLSLKFSVLVLKLIRYFKKWSYAQHSLYRWISPVSNTFKKGLKIIQFMHGPASMYLLQSLSIILQENPVHNFNK